jgi:hypothetical protein
MVSDLQMILRREVAKALHMNGLGLFLLTVPAPGLPHRDPPCGEHATE